MTKKYKHGTMNIKSQEITFDGFIRAIFYSIGVIGCVLIILALFFA